MKQDDCSLQEPLRLRLDLVDAAMYAGPWCRTSSLCTSCESCMMSSLRQIVRASLTCSAPKSSHWKLKSGSKLTVVGFTISWFVTADELPLSNDAWVLFCSALDAQIRKQKAATARGDERERDLSGTSLDSLLHLSKSSNVDVDDRCHESYQYQGLEAGTWNGMWAAHFPLNVQRPTPGPAELDLQPVQKTLYAAEASRSQPIGTDFYMLGQPPKSLSQGLVPHAEALGFCTEYVSRVLNVTVWTMGCRGCWSFCWMRHCVICQHMTVTAGRHGPLEYDKVGSVHQLNACGGGC